MKLLVGLGNPGKEYENTRHNVGAAFVDFVAKGRHVMFINKFRSLYGEFQQNGEKVILIKPQTFMNDSGSAVQEAAKFYKVGPGDILIAFDDLDITQGEFKIQKGKYPKVHNGINDIIKKVGSDEFTFIRIGIESRTPTEREYIPGREYVLQKTLIKYDEVFTQILQELHNRTIV